MSNPSGDNGAGGKIACRIANDIAAVVDGVTHDCTFCELVAVQETHNENDGSAHSEPGDRGLALP